eukprot:90688_1
MGAMWSNTIEDKDKSSIKFKLRCDNNEISNCKHLDYFAEIMNKHNYVQYMKQINITQVLDSFLHLIHQHDSDEEFEFICNKLGHCCLKKCIIHKRHNDTVCQILDKMHCYYHHCYDLGHRLTLQDKTQLEKTIASCDEKRQDYISNECIIDHELKTDEIMAISQMLSSKREKLSDVRVALDIRANQKYNTSFCVNKITSSDQILYSFGFEFNYGDNIFLGPKAVSVTAKYHSLKEELTSNKLATISMNQFDNEYEKARIHFNSIYCRNTFRERSGGSPNSTPKYPFLLKYVLSLMIYCNFTQLQYKFSKTYRDKNGIQHNSFYHLGRCLQIAVHTFGQNIRDANVQKFYHGIGEQLLFPQYVGLYCDGISINCPLSTSSSLVVAMNFTNNNNGLIIEFTDIDYPNTTKCFGVSWLSNYGNESEYLFIQTGVTNGKLNINNIIDPKM